MPLALLILAAGLVVLAPLVLWARQREREAIADAERTLARLRRRHVALTTRMHEIAEDIHTLYGTDTPPAAPPANPPSR